MYSAAERELYTSGNSVIYFSGKSVFLFHSNVRTSFEIRVGSDMWLRPQTGPKIRCNPDILRGRYAISKQNGRDYVSAYSEADYVSHSCVSRNAI